MTGRETEQNTTETEQAPESVPPKAWLTFVMFALFVVGLGSCASLWMFN